MTEVERLAQALTDWSTREVRDLDRLDAAVLLRSQAAEIEALKQTLYDELDANLRLRELGGAKPDEPMTTFLERVFAEREALRADAERLEWLRARIPGGTYRIMGVIYSEGGAGVDAAIDAARQS